MSAKKKQKPLKYFLSQISPYSPLKAACPSCETTTSFSSHIHLSTSKGSIHINYYQCQSCGKLDTSDEKNQEGTRVALETRCECGGQFRRDKNIFCPNCQYRKSEENKAEDKLIATLEEMKNLTLRHGTEEMTSSYKGDDIATEAEEEESDMKKLIRALHNFTKDGSEYSFGFSMAGKGGETYYSADLDNETESLLYNWINDELIEESNYSPTDYIVTATETGIKLDCTASWDTSDYEDDYYSYEDLIDKKIVNILLPNHAYESVNLEALPLSFEYSYENKNYQFVWHSDEDTEEYFDEATGTNIIIPLKDLKPKLEPLLHEKLYTLDAGDGAGQGETTLKVVSIDYGRIRVSETAKFQMYFDIDDY